MPITVTFTGVVLEPPVLRQAGGHAVTNIRVAVTPDHPGRSHRAEYSVRDSHTGESMVLAVTAWRELAHQVVAHAERGSTVLVTGHLKQRTFTARSTRPTLALEIEADSIGVPLDAAAHGRRRLADAS